MSRLIGGAMLCGLVLALVAPVSAQVPATSQDGDLTQPGKKPIPLITLEQAEAALNAVESDDQLDDAVKSSLRSKYQQAIEELRERQRLEAQTGEYRKTLESAPELVKQLRDKLEALSAIGSDEAALPDGDPQDWQWELDLRRIKFGELNDQLAQSSKQLREFSRRPAQISSRIPQIERQLRGIRKELSSPELAQGFTSPNRVAERSLLDSQQSRLLSERENLQQELLSLSVREDLLEAENELLKQQLKIAAGTVKALNSSLYERLSKDAREIRTRVDSLSEDLPAGTDADQEFAAEVQELAQQFETIVRLQPSVQNAQDNIAHLFQIMEEDYLRLQELRGLSTSGTLTVQVLHRLQRAALRAHLDVRTMELPALDEVQLASIQVRETLAGQSDVEQKFADSASEAVSLLVSLRRELLEGLQQQQGTQRLALAKLKQNEQEYRDRAAEVRSDISAQLLGFEVHSSPPLAIDSLTEIPQGLNWVFSRDHWSAYGNALVRYVTEQPVINLGLLLIVTGLLVGRRWIQKALVRSGAEVGKISKDRFSRTLQAVVWTILLAAPLPLLIGFAFRVTLHATETSDWMFGLSDGLWHAARIASFAEVAVAVCLHGGLGEVHLRWSNRVLVLLRRMIRRLMVVYLPTIVLTSLCAVGESSQYFGSVGLVSFLLAHLWAVFVLWQLVRALDRAPEPGADNLRKAHVTLRRLGFSALQICLIALSIVACLGYLLTAIQLSQGLVWTVARIFGGVTLYYLTLRWFAIRKRRLKLAEAVERRRARLKEAERGEPQEESGEIVSVNLENQQGMDLDSVSEHLRNLLRLLFSLLVGMYVVFLWTRIYPLADVMDSISIPLGEALTLLGLIKAILIVIVTVILVRILPGLLELTFLRATTIDSGTRHAIYTLGQYAVISLGFVMVTNAVNMDWAKLGWIAAGLSVGLGFGLQEVVANFVCGLILLFERPIRVGDVVTINGTTGTVTRINIRATTIMNWDRQDFVVPNKNLITGTILNWTLTASVNRIVVSVGVAYGTDTEKAQQILLDVANEHPRILDDPAPFTSFEQFGDSSLNLVLFAYLPDLDYRIKTITDMHTTINKRFAAAGIEIAFPQRDVHLRSAEESSAAAYGEEID